MKLSDVVKKHKDKLLEVAEENTVRNEDGHTVITKEDEDDD